MNVVWSRKPKYGAFPYQPYFGIGTFAMVASQRELESERLPAGYRFERGVYLWEPATEIHATAPADFLYEHYLSRYRAADVDTVPPTRRMFVLGGSLAVGSSASSRETAWHAVLERRLGEMTPGAPTVFNCAMGGFVTTQEVMALTFAVLPRQPAAVVFLNGFNNLVMSYTHATRPGDPSNISTAMKSWYERPLVHGRDNPKMFEALHDHIRRVLSDPEARGRLQRSTANVYVEHMGYCIELCRTLGVRCAVVFQPWREMTRRKLGMEIDRSDFHVSGVGNAIEETFDLVRQRMVAAHGDGFHDLTGVFDHPDQVAWYTDYCHVDDRGQERIGNAIAQIVGGWFHEQKS